MQPHPDDLPPNPNRPGGKYIHPYFTDEYKDGINQNVKRQHGDPPNGEPPEPPPHPTRIMAHASYVIAAISNSSHAPETSYRQLQNAAACPAAP